ncbi:hypothetical protein VFPFJ_04638 [Purpureocillium lilacinum]|uniref:Uncharacterized protein n=1 Tax=Purpureocillium lilacinum TaxID=33203 RepID=A0A179HLD0_PURLI|nr:hypothetical protein VFPFJ_04638 [Purpureocillium lilacinum]OAQ90478.1 hypothetical protein VFPFJ_04638 [Purpureocillium lilacinum]
MTSFILPPRHSTTGPRKRSAYCSILTHVVRAAADAHEALELFGALVRGETAHGLSSFDPHVGESACHLRATMMWEVYRACSRENQMVSADGSARLVDGVDAAAAHFALLRKSAELACAKLSIGRASPGVVGLGNRDDTPENIVRIAAESREHASDRGNGTLRMNGHLLAPSSSMKLHDAQSYPPAWNLRDTDILVRFIVYSLARDSVQVSAKGMAATACFPTYLLVRDFWARSNCGIVLVDRHFCPKGFHYNLLTVRLRHRPGRRRYERDLSAPVYWDVEETSVERLSEADDNEPHIIVVGNSIDGSSTDYLTRLASGTALQLSRLHHDDTCPEAVAHARKLRFTDHERLAKASFAAHPSYCIELEDRPNEPDIINDLLEQAGQSNSIDTFRHMWERCAAELGALGGGQESLRMFCWQHVFAETKRGLAEMLRNWIMHVEMDSN